MLCLDKICEQKDFFKDLVEHKEPFASAHKKPYLKIQCKNDKKCTCPTNKKKHFQKHFHKSSFKKPKKPYRYFRKKDPSQFRKKKYNRCFVCKKHWHFAHNCPNKSAKVVRLIHPYFLAMKMLNPSSQNSQRKMIIQPSFLISIISTVQEINQIRSKLTGPSVNISVIPSKFYKPISVIRFLDTSA